MQHVLPVPPAMFELCGCDFMSDSEGINIFFKGQVLLGFLFVFTFLTVNSSAAFVFFKDIDLVSIC